MNFSLPTSDDTISNSTIELAFVHLLPSKDPSRQVVSLVDLSTTSETLIVNNLVNESQEWTNKILHFSESQNFNFQGEILSTGNCEQDNYSEFSLINAEETSVLLHRDSNKAVTVSALENYLTQLLPTFLNL